MGLKGQILFLSQPVKMQLCERYRPISLSQIVGRDYEIGLLKKWLRNASSSEFGVTKGALLTGPPGTGKTSLAYALANDSNYSIVEFNASDTRSQSVLEQRISPIICCRLQKPTILLLEEIDGLDGHADGGAVAVILRMIHQSHIPIILTANELYKQTIKSVRDDRSILKIQLKPFPPHVIATHLGRISLKERYRMTPQMIWKIAQTANGDLRSALNNLDFESRGGGVLHEGELLEFDDKARTVFQSANMLFSRETAWDMALNAGWDDLAHEMVMENYPQFCDMHDPDDPKGITDAHFAAELMSEGDLMDPHTSYGFNAELAPYHNALCATLPARYLGTRKPHTQPSKIEFPIHELAMRGKLGGAKSKFSKLQKVLNAGLSGPIAEQRKGMCSADLQELSNFSYRLKERQLGSVEDVDLWHDFQFAKYDDPKLKSAKERNATYLRKKPATKSTAEKKEKKKREEEKEKLPEEKDAAANVTDDSSGLLPDWLAGSVDSDGLPRTTSKKQRIN